MSLHYDEKGKFFTDYVSKDAIQAIIQTTNNRIEGEVYVRSGERVSDLLNSGGPFLAVTNARILDQNGAVLKRVDFLAVNQNLIIWLAPVDDASQDEPAENRP